MASTIATASSPTAASVEHQRAAPRGGRGAGCAARPTAAGDVAAGGLIAVKHLKDRPTASPPSSSTSPSLTTTYVARCAFSCWESWRASALVERLVTARAGALRPGRPRRRPPRSSRRTRAPCPTRTAAAPRRPPPGAAASARSSCLAPGRPSARRPAATAAPRATRGPRAVANARLGERRPVDRPVRERPRRRTARRTASRTSVVLVQLVHDRVGRERPPRRAARAPPAPSTSRRRSRPSARRTGPLRLRQASARPRAVASGADASCRRLGGAPRPAGLLAAAAPRQPRLAAASALGRPPALSRRLRRGERPRLGSAAALGARRRLGGSAALGASPRQRPRARRRRTARRLGRQPPRRRRRLGLGRRRRVGLALGREHVLGEPKLGHVVEVAGLAVGGGTIGRTGSTWPSTRLIDSDSRRRSESISRILTRTGSPGWMISRGFSTWCWASSEMWTSPSTPSRISTNAPNVTTLVTVPSSSSPML